MNLQGQGAVHEKKLTCELLSCATKQVFKCKCTSSTLNISILKNPNHEDTKTIMFFFFSFRVLLYLPLFKMLPLFFTLLWIFAYYICLVCRWLLGHCLPPKKQRVTFTPPFSCMSWQHEDDAEEACFIFLSGTTWIVQILFAPLHDIDPTAIWRIHLLQDPRT